MNLGWRDVEVAPGRMISTSMTAAEGARLTELAEVSVSALEVGAAFGYSMVMMGRTGVHLVSVDPHDQIDGSWDTFNDNMRWFRLVEQTWPLRELSQQALPRLYRCGARFDLIFIDGDHAEAAVRHDAEWGQLLLMPGGTLAFHDYGEETCPGVAAALDSIFPLGPTQLTDTLYEVAP